MPIPPVAGVADLIAGMTLERKLAQLVGLWEGGSGDTPGDGTAVAPLQDAMAAPAGDFAAFAKHGLGHLTRPFGTAPVDPVEGARALAAKQAWLREHTGVGAIVHEECLTGLAAWRATTFPAPPAWGAAFDPDTVREMAGAIAASMRALGVHQGLAPVLDVVRDLRWGRVEECIGEDPLLVATVGSAYVRGLQGGGVDATLKHFVGYSGSRAGRNLAPVHAGPREVADVLMPPFEAAVLDAGAASVMNSYAEIDGLPVAADAGLLTGVLRDRWGFAGTVVADYFSVAFLHSLHGVAADLGDAAAQALAAGIDVELPTGTAYLEPLAARVRAGALPEELVDRALARVLEQKWRHGLVGAGPAPSPPAHVDLDPPAHRALAARLAERGVVLVGNTGALPLAAPARIAVVGPNADDPAALLGCYSFANHVLPRHPGVELGITVPTVAQAVAAEFPGAAVTTEPGLAAVDGTDRAGFAAAVVVAREAEVCVAVVGDRAGLFGRGTSGEGCDTDSLELPGAQGALVEALLDTGTPVVLVLVTGRPYALGGLLDRCAATVQAFFPGQEGAAAVAGVLSGRVNPSGRLPIGLPRSAGGQPAGYLHPRLGGPSPVTNLDPTPLRPFGFGLSYTTFAHSALGVPADVPTRGSLCVACTVTNTGDRPGADVVQLYAGQRVASVTRPVAQLLGFARVELAPGASARVELDVPAARLAFTDRRGVRVVEPGALPLFVGTSCADPVLSGATTLTGPVHEITPADRRTVGVTVRR